MHHLCQKRRYEEILIIKILLGNTILGNSFDMYKITESILQKKKMLVKSLFIISFHQVQKHEIIKTYFYVPKTGYNDLKLLKQLIN